MGQEDKRMSETTSRSQRSAGLANFTRRERLHLNLVAAGILLALALAIVVLRLQHLHEIPPGLGFDEGVDGVLALEVLRGDHAVFFSEYDYGRDPFAIYVLALSTALLGRTLLAMHLPTALGSAGLVLVVFWLGRLLFGQDEKGRATSWRGLFVGGVSAGLMAVSVGQTHMARASYNKVTFMPMLLVLCLGLLWQGWGQRSWRRVVLAGICAGLLPYTYKAAWFTPFLFLLFGLTFLLPFGPAAKQRVRKEMPWIAAFVGVTGLVAAPFLVNFALHSDQYSLRTSGISLFNPMHSQGNPLAALLGNVWIYFLAFGFRGNQSVFYNVPGVPMLNLVETFFFWLGVGAAAWRWPRMPAYRLLLLWLGVLLLPAVLSEAEGAWPNPHRMNGAAPAVYLLIAVGLWEAFRFLRERHFRKSEIRSGIVMGAAVSCLLLVQGINAYRTYFHQWATLPELHRAFEVPWVNLARVLNAQPSSTDAVYVIPNFQHRYSFDYLYQGTAPAFLVHTAMPELAKAVESTLAGLDNVSTVRVVEWGEAAAWVGQDMGRLAVLFSKYGYYQSADEYPDFRFHNYTDISLDRPWTFYERLEPLTVEYDGGIGLRGLALGQGVEQLTSRQLLHLERGRPLWMVLQWETVSELDADYAISLRLYNAEAERSFQEDSVLKSSLVSPTSDWTGDEPVETVALLNVPADLPAGEYELRMVVYDFETLTPTVETGVWEPEVTLARLRLAHIQR